LEPDLSGIETKIDDILVLAVVVCESQTSAKQRANNDVVVVRVVPPFESLRALTDRYDNRLCCDRVGDYSNRGQKNTDGFSTNPTILQADREFKRQSSREKANQRTNPNRRNGNPHHNDSQGMPDLLQRLFVAGGSELRARVLL